MRFNYEKFREDTNQSGYYSKWKESLMNTLEEAGSPRPSYDYLAHHFPIYIGREPTKTGRRRGQTSITIICPNDGEIRIELSPNLKKEEISVAVEKAVKFLTVMISAGYIVV